jgi:hypothetical protein
LSNNSGIIYFIIFFPPTLKIRLRLINTHFSAGGFAPLNEPPIKIDNQSLNTIYWKEYTFVSKSLIYYLKLPDSSVYRVRITEYNKGFVLVEVL